MLSSHCSAAGQGLTDVGECEWVGTGAMGSCPVVIFHMSQAQWELGSTNDPPWCGMWAEPGPSSLLDPVVLAICSTGFS
jgi:hypothetical protein